VLKETEVCFGVPFSLGDAEEAMWKSPCLWRGRMVSRSLFDHV